MHPRYLWQRHKSTALSALVLVVYLKMRETENNADISQCLHETLTAHNLTSLDQLPPSLPIHLLCKRHESGILSKVPKIRPPAQMDFMNYYWQVLTTLKHETVFMYSAFYDDRKILRFPTVRVLTTINKSEWVETDFQCILWLSNGSILKVDAKVKTMKPPFINHDTFEEYKYFPFFISCEITDETEVPLAVSLVDKEANSKTVSNILQLVDNRPTKDRQDFMAVCVKHAWFEGRNYVHKVAEWLELQFMLGIDKVFISPFFIDEDVRKLLGYHKERVELQSPFSPSYPPRSADGNEKHCILHETLFYNDCLLRNIHRFEYLAILDTDEVLMPLQENNLRDLMSNLEEENKVRTNDFVFLPRLLLDEMMNQDKLKKTPKFRTIQSRTKCSPPLENPSIHQKFVLRTSDVLSIFQHFSQFCLTSEDGTCNHTTVGPDRAQMSHYRKWCRDSISDKDCRKHIKKAVPDNSINRFAQELGQRTEETLRHLGMLSA